MSLPDPKRSLSAEGVTVAAPGTNKPLIQGVTFELKAGQGLGIIGPSASGKSTLARSLVGAWRPIAGRVMLDGASIAQWSSQGLGRHIGYLPQDVELFDGTVAENISRFERNAEPADIIAAARAARVHDLIVGLRDGYETVIGPQGALLSAGQRQRIALARALYRDPFLVILDEPNSNLDIEGEAALAEAIRGVRQRGGIVAIVAHRPSALQGVDHLMVMNQGSIQAFGPRDEILSKMFPRPKPQSASASNLRIVATKQRTKEPSNGVASDGCAAL